MDDWGKRRQRLIEIILAAAAIALIAVVLIATLYKAPSCTDGKQDQNEAGIDCGGPCPYLCAANETPLGVSFVRALSPEPGRTDVISYITNSNSNAAIEGARYTIELYDSSQNVIATKTGLLNVPPGSTVPVFIPDFYEGTKKVSAAFLTFDPSSLLWERSNAQQILPSPSNIQIQDTPAPRITADVTNTTANTLYNETIIATIFDASNNVIAASQTVIPIFSAESISPVVFTWNEPFPGKPVRVELLPASGS